VFATDDMSNICALAGIKGAVRRLYTSRRLHTSRSRGRILNLPEMNHVHDSD
jgi:hypothetical protein